MSWLDQKYIGIISSRLDRFKRTQQNIFNFRCPICGDSQKNKSKARGFLFTKDDGKYLYHCHNCNVTMGLDKFILSIDPTLHSNYVKERFESDVTGVNRVKTDLQIFEEKLKKPKFISSTALKRLKKISQLEHNHPAKRYVISRGIPNPYHAKLFYAPKFKRFVNSIQSNRFEDTKYDEPRLIIPFLDEEKKLFGFQGRSFSNLGLRYITIMLDDSKPKIYGLEECDRTKTHFIFEGPIDSMFVKNSIAMAGTSINWDYVNGNSVFVFDNEPRSKQICDNIQKIIDKGHKVSFFPEHVKGKDVNEMIMNDSSIDITSVLSHNITSGLEAKIIFTAWKRI